MKWIRKYWFTLLGIAQGALLGYLYWLVIGCPNGTCALTSSPVNSTLLGAVIGGLVLNMFQRNKKNEDE